MVDSNPEPRFVCVSAIFKEENITPQWLGREVVADSRTEKHLV